GISPRASGQEVTLPPDNAQRRWGDWIAGLDDAGEVGGGVVAEIDSKAESANTGTGTLAADITNLEGRVATLESVPPSHTHPQSSITGLVARLEAMESRLAAAESRLDDLENPPAP